MVNAFLPPKKKKKVQNNYLYIDDIYIPIQKIPEENQASESDRGVEIIEIFSTQNN